MADTIVSTIMNYLSQLLMTEANFFREGQEQVISLRNELEYINNFLKHSKVEPYERDNVMTLMDQINDVAREAEDMVDTYVYDVAKGKRDKSAMYFGSVGEEMLHFNSGELIWRLKTKAAEIYENRDEYDIQQNRVNEYDLEFLKMDDLGLSKQRIQVEEDDVVGFAEEAATLVNQLVKGNAEELDVISISGIGGLGKTTLARKVYKDRLVRNRFRLRAWVSVSQELKLKELLLAILDQVTRMTEEMTWIDEKKLKEKLKKHLSNHRYLVVLDDIWNQKHWDELKLVFPNDKNGSRVLVTTQIIDVAWHAASGNSPLELRFLNDEEGWELFTKKVFQGQPCPEDLKPLGEKMVAKCGGLPLAIMVLGGLLACKDKDEHTWNAMVGSANWQIAHETRCLDTLGLSYKYLPPYLRPCFLLLGLFPEDYKIPVKQLIQLWISEGFVEHKDNTIRRKEDVAEDYLHQLIGRSLIQVEEWRSDGGVKTCTCHDLIRDLCLKLSEEEKFLESHSGIPSSQTKPRRLSILWCREDYISKADQSNTCHVRTLLSFYRKKYSYNIDWKKLCKRFKLLRVLQFVESISNHPKAIAKLILLRYLSIETTHLQIADDVVLSICSLHNLQTLDLRNNDAFDLPIEVWSMQQLRHLYLSWYGRLPPTAATNCLSNLQTLCYMGRDPEVKIAEKAPNLRKLGLYCRTRSYYSVEEDESIFDLPYLESLKFKGTCIFELPTKLPQSITKISVKGTLVEYKTMEKFQNLSNLQILKLDGASFEGNELVFEEGWFQELQLLKIENSSIVCWKLGQGAVPKLKRLVISKCPDLNMIPEGLWDIPALEKLELSWIHFMVTTPIAEIKQNKVEVVIYPGLASIPVEPDA